MNEIPTILGNVAHRPWSLPSGPWQYYQEWNRALFLHWEVSAELLRQYIPRGLKLDLFEGKAYVSLVAFTMQNIRPRNLPALRFLSDFHEINIRTYIDTGNKKGVYFLNIEAEKYLSVFVAKNLSGLPYEKSAIARSVNAFHSSCKRQGFSFQADFEIGQTLLGKSVLDKWLTERYCLYLDNGDNTYLYEIHHKEWEMKNVSFTNLKVSYKIGEIELGMKPPEISHYSEGGKVLAWKRQRL